MVRNLITSNVLIRLFHYIEKLWFHRDISAHSKHAFIEHQPRVSLYVLKFPCNYIFMALPKVTLHYHTLEVSPYYLVANIVTSKKVRGATQTIKSINFLYSMRTEITKFPGNLITLHTPGKYWSRLFSPPNDFCENFFNQTKIPY